MSPQQDVNQSGLGFLEEEIADYVLRDASDDFKLDTRHGRDIRSQSRLSADLQLQRTNNSLMRARDFQERRDQQLANDESKSPSVMDLRRQLELAKAERDQAIREASQAKLRAAAATARLHAAQRGDGLVLPWTEDFNDSYMSFWPSAPQLPPPSHVLQQRAGPSPRAPLPLPGYQRLGNYQPIGRQKPNMRSTPHLARPRDFSTQMRPEASAFVPQIERPRHPQELESLLINHYNAIECWGARYLTSFENIPPKSHAGSIWGDLHHIFKGNLELAGRFMLDRASRGYLAAAVINRRVVTACFKEPRLFQSYTKQFDIEHQILWDRLNHQSLHSLSDRKLLLEQMAQLISRINSQSNIHVWKKDKAGALAKDIMVRLSPLVDPAEVSLATAQLVDLAMKGLRIALRMRGEAVSWMIDFPTSGRRYEPSGMIFRNNDPSLLAALRMSSDFRVLLSFTPSMTKADYSGGVSRSTAVRRGEVIIVRK